jgi:fatty acid desaturase
MRPRMSARAFAPAASRLWWLPVHLAVIVVGTLAVAGRWLPWAAAPAIAIAIGLSFAGLMFLGHELLHGGVLHGHKRLRSIIGWICFAPFTVAPRLWVAWHNRIHHAHTNELGVDPDMYPSLAAYKAGGRTRFSIDHFGLGGRRWRGAFSLLVGFIVQSKDQLLSGPKALRMSRRAYRLTVAETVLQMAMWIAIAIAIGGYAFIFAFGIPLVIADIIVMAFILTNHSLSPATAKNDPLLNSLSIRGPRWLEWVTLGFGYHVEHHMFPGISTRHGGEVRTLIRELWPERYQSMTLGAALRAMHDSGRVYKDATTLVDPRTGGEFPTLSPRDSGAPALAAPQAIQLAALNL